MIRAMAEASRPRVLVIGGDDVHLRIELMQQLRDEFTLAAAGTSPALAERFSAHGFEYFNYPMGRGANPVGDFLSVRALWRLLRHFRPQIVHAFDTKPCVYARLTARLAGVPVVVGTVPGLGSLYIDNGQGKGLLHRVVRGVYEGLQRVASRSADLTIFQNQDNHRDFTAKGIVPRQKATVIPGSGVRTDVFDPAKISAAERRQARASLGVPDDALLVTMIARLIRSKGVEDFVGAAEEVRRHRPDAHFLLVGPADAKSVDCFAPEELTQLTRAINWPGARSDVPRILAASDVFVLPSFYPEGIPRVLLEAASMGLPIVTTRSPGCTDVVEEGVNGFLMAIRDRAALTTAVLRLAESEELRRRFGDASRRHAVAHFDLRVIAERTRGIYRDLLASRSIGLGSQRA